MSLGCVSRVPGFSVQHIYKTPGEMWTVYKHAKNSGEYNPQSTVSNSLLQIAEGGRCSRCLVAHVKISESLVP